MPHAGVHLTGRERSFPPDEIIVSKTDPQGRLTYVNDIFLEVAGYGEAELIGKPHSIIRHPAMPRTIFRRLWETVRAGQEIFAYVNNRAKNGDHYWVLAHVTPNMAPDGTIAGYHSNRRVPRRAVLGVIEPLYGRLAAAERAAGGGEAGMTAAALLLDGILDKEGVGYDEFVLGL
ncbi:PAS domain S-box-containing protein [Azospirillum agricola]|uniref:PAS domain-containing protein n=1 Tax=Azospirillum agricola TaxID=1720247 RepID=UPI001AE5C6FC|nr:PAS domain-containing protein [Azospirillum agricola]MBP2229984.1 PAS domain S-box-containing protein [Azospirillum agricola]